MYGSRGMKGTGSTPSWVTDTGEARTRGLWCVTILVLAIWGVGMFQAASARASAGCTAGATMNVVAHPDDDLLFLSPDLLHQVRSGKCVRTVYITAGERGGHLGRLQSRESGVEAAYAQMAGVANSWTTTDAGVPGHRMPLVTLTGRPTVSLVFMRLPEGFWGDRGTARNETLQNLWLGNVPQLHVEDGSLPYAQIPGPGNTWTPSDTAAPGLPMPLVTLTQRPTPSLGFMPLAEAFSSDGGTARGETAPNPSLSTVPQLRPQAGLSTYTKSGLTAALTELMNAMRPDTIRTEDYVGRFEDGDHDDHHAAAYFARSAQLGYSVPHVFIGYLDYASEARPQNAFNQDLTAKTKAYYAYLAHDSAPCGDPPDCGTNDYSRWLKRQFIVRTEHSKPAIRLLRSTGPI
jgi:LmbE family N-acetylglucosaminyl deacetylase